MQIKYIEGFAGIGGFRLGFEQACSELNIKSECVFAFEKDKFARQTYFTNFSEEPAGDITKIPSKDIPGRKHKDDVLFFFAGFPCQPWSAAGKQQGVDDERNMIPQVVRIISDKHPDVFILENVKGLKSKKFKDVYDRLMWDLKVICGYTVYERIYNANAVVPQNRQRIFIVGFKNPVDFEFPELPPIYPVLKDVLEFENVPEKYFLKEKTIQWLIKVQNNKKHGFGFNICDFDGCANTIPATYGCDGSECLIPKISRVNTIATQYGSNGGVATLIPKLKKIGYVNKDSQGQRIYDINGIAVTQSALGGGCGAKTGLYATPEIKIIDGIEYVVDYSKVRKLTPRECARVMGFSDDFKIVVSDSQAYRQFGNAVVPEVVKEIAKAVINLIY
jgi:DNA (cytosine-5)-methyltransferase 1